VQIWIDGDACPKQIKEILFRAAERTKTQLYFVSNHFVSIPPSAYIKRIMVGSGFDVADSHIVTNIKANDLAITADIPLANDIIEKKAYALNPRGELYSAENIKQILARRNFNESLRSSGMLLGGAGKISAKEIQAFSNNLDKLITKNK